MAQFELGGSVSVDQTFQSSFAQELVKETSILCNESVYKSSFATELLESSHNNSGAKISEVESEENSEENMEAFFWPLCLCSQWTAPTKLDTVGTPAI